MLAHLLEHRALILGFLLVDLPAVFRSELLDGERFSGGVLGREVDGGKAAGAELLHDLIAVKVAICAGYSDRSGTAVQQLPLLQRLSSLLRITSLGSEVADRLRGWRHTTVAAAVVAVAVAVAAPAAVAAHRRALPQCPGSPTSPPTTFHFLTAIRCPNPPADALTSHPNLGGGHGVKEGLQRRRLSLWRAAAAAAKASAASSQIADCAR